MSSSLFSIPFLFLMVGLFALFLVLGNADQTVNQTIDCPCEKIIMEGKCDNPDCITVCNLQSFFDEAGQFIGGECLEEGIKEQNFTLREAMISALPGFLKESQEEIKRIEKKNEAILKSACPNCYLHSKIEAQFVPKTKKETCDRQHLKTHEYSYAKKLELREDQTCGEEQKNQIHKDLQNYSENIIRRRDNELSRKIRLECPDGCTFDIVSVIQIDTKDCSGDLSLKINCTHRAEANLFTAFMPVYSAFINYKGGVKCQ